MDVLGLDRRRLGAGLLAFGMVGVVLAGLVSAALVAGGLAVRDLDQRLLEDQARIAASLTRVSATMESLAITTEHAGSTLTSAGDTLGNARDTLGDVATTTVSVAAAIDIDILGKHPFAGAAEDLQALARRIQTFEADADELAQRLATNATAATAMTTQIRLLKGQVNEVAARVAGFDRIDQLVGLVVGGIVVAGALTAWVLVGAAFCAWAGWRMRRTGYASAAG